MNCTASSIIEMAARLLRVNQRDAVLGDLAEAGEGLRRSLCAIFGLVARQQAGYWREWPPWLAGGVALSGSLLLLGVSFQLSMNSRTLRQGDFTHAGLPLLCEALLLLAWSWTSGYIISSLSRRTLWVSAVFCCTPCLSCVLRFREPSLSRLCVLLFLAPGLLGVLHALRRVRLHFAAAIALAAAITGLMFAWKGMWLWNWPLVLPAWFLAATAHQSGRGREELTS